MVSHSGVTLAQRAMRKCRAKPVLRPEPEEGLARLKVESECPLITYSLSDFPAEGAQRMGLREAHSQCRGFELRSKCKT